MDFRTARLEAVICELEGLPSFFQLEQEAERARQVELVKLSKQQLSDEIAALPNNIVGERDSSYYWLAA